MYLVVMAWLYVTVLMALAEATSANGTALGASVTFVLYGLLPMSIVLYILGTPGRKRALRARQQAEVEAASGGQPDAGRSPPGRGKHKSHPLALRQMARQADPQSAESRQQMQCAKRTQPAVAQNCPKLFTHGTAACGIAKVRQTVPV